MNDILNIYQEILHKTLGFKPKVKYIEKAEVIKTFSKYQIKYCRLFNRRFDNKKVLRLVGCNYNFMPLREGLTRCINQFITEKRKFKNISWAIEAQFDRITNEKTPLCEISGFKNKIVYFLYRYTPYERIRLLLKKLTIILFLLLSVYKHEFCR